MSSSSEPPSPTLGRTFLDRLTSVFHEEELNDRADVLEVLGEARRRNVIDDEVFSMMEGAMAVSEIRAGDLMVPRSQVQAVDFSEPREVWLPALIASGHSRLPAVEDDLDNVLGILVEIDDTRCTFTHRCRHHLFHNLFNRIGLTLDSSGQRPATQGTETHFTHLDLVTILFRQTIIISHNQITVDLYNRTFLGKV